VFSPKKRFSFQRLTNKTDWSLQKYSIESVSLLLAKRTGFATALNYIIAEKLVLSFSARASLFSLPGCFIFL